MVTDDRTGFDRLRAELRRLERLEIRVGVLQSAPTEGGESTITVVAAAHEYGTATIPQRSFIGRTMDQKREQLGELQAQAIDAVLAGEKTAEQAAGAVGAVAASMVQATIRSNVPPPLKPETVARKGHSRTLIDSGQLLRSIQHEVVQKGDDA
jgi:hypothetical protein